MDCKRYETIEEALADTSPEFLKVWELHKRRPMTRLRFAWYRVSLPFLIRWWRFRAWMKGD